MLEVERGLLKVQKYLEEIIESPSELIDRLKQEGKSMSEIEQAVLELTRIQGVYDSVGVALKILEVYKKTTDGDCYLLFFILPLICHRNYHHFS